MSQKFIEKLLGISLNKTKGGKTQRGSNEQTKLVKIILSECKFEKLTLKTKPTKIGLYYIEQPFGTQKFPDFLLYNYIDENDIRILQFELKKSNSKTLKWNDGFPQENSLYLFSGKSNMLFTRDCVSSKDIELYHNFCTEINEIKEKYKGVSKRFNFYPRKSLDEKIDEKNKNEYLNKSLAVIKNFFNESD